MKPLAPSEKKLFLIFCGTIFIVLNMIGVRSFLQARDKVQLAVVAAKAELTSDRSWLDVGDSLHAAMTWMDSHPMPELEPDDASAKLLKTEREEAEKAGLKVTEENLLPSQNDAQDSSVAVEAKLSGPFQGVVHMLFALQTPTAWRNIDKLTLRSDTEPPNVVADLELRQYFRHAPAASSSSVAPQPSGSPIATPTP